MLAVGLLPLPLALGGATGSAFAAAAPLPYFSIAAFPDNPTSVSQPSAVALAPDGDVIIADKGNNRIRVLSSAGALKASFGSKGTTPGRFLNPGALALGPDNRIYVADTGNNRVQVFERDGTLVRLWGSLGTADGQMNSPGGIAVGADGRVYVSDSFNARVQVFSAAGVFLEKWGSKGVNPDQFDLPMGIAVDSANNVYVVDQNKFYVKKFDGATHAWVANWGWNTATPSTSRFSSPMGISIGAGGTELVVSDTGNCRIETSDFSGNMTETVGSLPRSTAIGSFSAPGAATVATDGAWFVADTYADRIQRRTPTGTWLAPWSTPSSQTGFLSAPEAVAADRTRGITYVADTGNSRILKYDSAGAYQGLVAGAGAGPGQVSSPKGLLVLSDGTLLVSDTGNNRIQRYDSKGAYLGSFGEANLLAPRALAVSAAGTLYVADTGHNQIARFTTGTWQYLSTIGPGTAGAADGQFSAPRGIDVTGNVLWVADTDNNRIQKFKADDGTFLGKAGSLGTATGKLNQPSAIMADGADVVVADTLNDRLQRFDTTTLASVLTYDGTNTKIGNMHSPAALAPAAVGRTLVLETDGCRVQELARDNVPPQASPMVLMTEGFETTTSPNYSVAPIVALPANGNSYWGRNSAFARTGGSSLWCAGSNPAAWRTYPQWSSGVASFDISQTADLYLSNFSFWYSMPSYGDADADSFNALWFATSNSANKVQHTSLPKTAINQFTQQTWDLTPTVSLSRVAGTVEFQWVDKQENFSQTTVVGEGPSVDDVALTGWRYGPARNLAAAPTPSQVALSWLRPYRAIGSTSPEERALEYRVWRTTGSVESPSDVWTMLSTSPVTDDGAAGIYTDTAVTPGTTYRYLVQAWQPGANAWGMPVQVTAAVPSASDTTPPTLSASLTAEADHHPSVTVTLTVSDNVDPNPTIQYSTDNKSTWTTCSAHPTFRTSADVWFRATDASNNTTTTPTSIHVDVVQPPTVSFQPDGGTNAPLTIKPIASSAAPGTLTIYYNTDGSSNFAPLGQATPTWSGLGTYWVYAKAVDQYGNWSSIESTKGVVRDTVAPAVTPSVVGDNTAQVIVSASATDKYDGAPRIEYSTDNQLTYLTYSAPLEFKKPGNWGVWFKAKDASGNESVPVYRFGIVASPPPPPPPPPPPHTPATVWRIPGANRYDVAVNLATQLRASRGAPFTDVVVACGEDRAMADPLGAAALAGAYGAPVLLTPSAKTNAGMLAAIASMRDANGGHIDIHVVGGTSSIPKAVYDQIAARRGSGTCERLNGRDRYDLARVMAQRTGAVLASKGRSVPAVMVVNIENPASFADALSASPISAHSGVPLIGVRGGGVPAEAAAALSYFPGAKRYAVNSAYLTPNVRAATGCDASPMATSANREVAATQIASFAVSKGLVGWHNVGLANKLSDALPAGAMVGELDGVMLYTNASPLSATTSALLAQVKGSVDHGWVFGGDLTIASSTQTEFTNALK